MFNVKSKHVPLVVFAMILLVTGCVSKVIDAPSVPVATTQNSEGVVTLSWESKVGYGYHLVARDMASRKMVIDSKLYRGTGKVITVQFKRDPNKPLPEYSARPEKLSD